MENEPSPIATGSEDDSLEGPSVAPTPGAASSSPPSPAPAPTPNGNSRWRRLVSKFNIYLLLLILILIIASAVVIGAYTASKRNPTTTDSSSNGLSQSALQQLANSNASVGSSNQVLTVQSSAIFAGRVLARQDVEVAGNLQIGGSLALNNITVAGTAQFGQAQVNKNLSVAGNTSLQGTASIAKSLQVSGGGTFGGAVSTPQLTAGSLQLSGDLVLTHHITAGGGTPGRSNGNALGGGGTSSVSGSDTSGSITINTGSSPAAGCFITVNFASAFGSTPHVIITPVGSNAAGLNYYVNRSTSSFSVCAASAAPANVSFGFDYFVIG